MWLVAGVLLYGLFLGDKAASDALLQRSGMLNMSGVQFLSYVEQPYINSILQFVHETQGKGALTPSPAPSCHRAASHLLLRFDLMRPWHTKSCVAVLT